MKLSADQFEKLALEQIDLLYRVACRLTRDPERAGDSDAIAGDAADDPAARRRQRVPDLLRQAGQHLGPGRARE